MSKLSNELLYWLIEDGEGEIALYVEVEKNFVRFPGDLEMNVLRVLNDIPSLRIQRILKFEKGEYTIFITIDSSEIGDLDDLDCIRKIQTVS